jgi:hypothetical protein
MNLQELASKAQDLLTRLPAETPVVFASDLEANIVVMVVNADGVQKIVIREA